MLGNQVYYAKAKTGFNWSRRAIKLKPSAVFDLSNLGVQINEADAASDLRALHKFVRAWSSRELRNNLEWLTQSTASLSKADWRNPCPSANRLELFPPVSGNVLDSETVKSIGQISLMVSVNYHHFNTALPLKPSDRLLLSKLPRQTSVKLSSTKGQLNLVWTVWGRRLKFVFNEPAYISNKSNFRSWLLPDVVFDQESRSWVFVFYYTENIPQKASNSLVHAGLDLGMKEPYTIVITNNAHQVQAEYRTSNQIKALYQKNKLRFEQLEKLKSKVDDYHDRGTDSSELELQVEMLDAKSARAARSVAQQMAAEIVSKVAKHNVSVFNCENLLASVENPKMSWKPQQTMDAIRIALYRQGIKINWVPCTLTSKKCAKCGGFVSTIYRDVLCPICGTRVDRDVNAAENISRGKQWKKTYSDG